MIVITTYLVVEMVVEWKSVVMMKNYKENEMNQEAMTNKKYNTEEEARAVADELNGNRIREVFCPLLRAMCLTSCECFIDAYPYKVVPNLMEKEKSHWVVYGFCCGNAMFSGDRNCQI